MFLINKEENRISEIEKMTLAQLGFRERDHLQEWLANNPEALGEELLIVQKEFAGFNDTNERLDLLALDKQGNLVVIENKLDDSGKDVTWQFLKYASYCSSLTKAQIIKIYQKFLDKKDTDESSEENLSEFLHGMEIEEIALNTGQTQRMILVSGAFRKEVTSTIMWLLNYGIQIQCFKTTPYSHDENLFLNIEQILPMKEAEEYSISMAEKTQENINSQKEIKQRHIVRRKFWIKVLSAMNKKSDLFQNISPNIYHWIGAGSGVRGVGFNFSATKSECRSELYIDRGEKSENEFVFDQLNKNKSDIESDFGNSLRWERLDSKRACRIKFDDLNFNIFDEDSWDETINLVTDAMQKMEAVFKPYLLIINKELKTL